MSPVPFAPPTEATPVNRVVNLLRPGCEWPNATKETAQTVPVEYLAGILAADFATGSLVWTRAGRRQGAAAFTCVSRNGYRCSALTWGGRQHFLYAHRVIWALAHGAWPAFGIDHVDGDRLNNSLRNLRDVPHSENMKNRKLHKSSASGICGVRFEGGKWRVRAPVRNGRTGHVGMFASLDDAIAARDSAYRALGYHENHGRAR